MGALGRGAGKLILFGEHAAVYGHPAVGISLDEKTVVSFDGDGLPAWELSAVDPADRGVVEGILSRLEELVPGLTARGRAAVQISSSVPRGAGFGSSAALTVAFAEAALGLAEGGGAGGAPPETGKTWPLAHELERLFHGTPSGIDTGLSLLGGLRAFTPRPPGLPGQESLGGGGFFLVAGAVRRTGDCGALVAGLRQRMQAGDQETRGCLDGLGEIAARAGSLLRVPLPAAAAAGLPPALGALAVQAMALLTTLGLGTPELEMLIREGERLGSVGGKLSGAGGGGAFFCVLPGQEAAREAAHGMRRAAESAGIIMEAAPRVVPVGTGGAGAGAALAGS
jgi:mevalonate kinase